MRTPRLPLWLFAIALLTLMPLQAHAQSVIAEVIGTIGGALVTVPTGTINCSGVACGFIGLADGLVFRLRPLMVLLAGLMIIIQGYRMIIGQEDDALEKGKTTITQCVSAIVGLYLYRPFVAAFFGGSGAILAGGNVNVGAGIVSSEVGGLINWFMITMGAMAVIFIIITGIRAVTSAGSEDGIANMRKNIIAIASGIFLIVFRVALNSFLGLTAPDPGGSISPVNPTPNALILVDAGITILLFFLGLIGVVAVSIFVYAGILMVLNLGNEENIQKGKSLLLRSGIGLIVIIMSLAIVNFVVRIAS